MKKAARFSLILLLFVLSLSAMGGGWMLITDPSGESIKFPPDLLKDTPFNNYLLPGLILFTFIGVLSLFTTILAVLNKSVYSKLAVIEGIILIGWLSIQLVLNNSFYTPILHLPLYLIGALLVTVGLWIIRLENRKTIAPNADRTNRA